VGIMKAYYVYGMTIRTRTVSALSCSLMLAATAALAGMASPAAAQNSTGLLTPFSTNAAPSFGGSQGGGAQGGGGQGGGGNGGNHSGGHHHDFPFFFTPFFDGFTNNGGTEQVQIGPVNPQPFAPAPPPLPGGRPETPYKAPSVEIAPGGVEIVRGPG
jgi:hypothetical protein